MELYGFANFDELLAFHCSPVLMNIKAANMISLPNSEEIDRRLEKYNREFAASDLVFRKLCCCTKRNLLFVYNKKRLEKILQDKGYRAYLTASGYDENNSLEDDLNMLEQHLQQSTTFPHEIGVFLEYPLEDVLGFVLNKGCNCKYSGYWKVYGNVNAAKKIFLSYEKSRDYLIECLNNGLSLFKAVSA